MAYTLVIVESPAKCKKIEQFLGGGYKCIASFGHIRELTGLKSINIDNNFEPIFTEIEGKKKQINEIKKYIRDAREVILAADDDREGEAIAWHICDTFNLSTETTKRMIFHEVTETAIKRAISDISTLNMDIVHAQHARQILDLIVGYTLSPILWNKISQKTKNGLSAGRCQTPALRLVYENQKDIDASPGKKVYNTIGYFTSKNIGFTLNYHHEDDTIMCEFLEETVNFEHIYSCGKIRDVNKQQPKPFTTSGLQQSASTELRLSPKDTMTSCQLLYEAGYITYMRTDSMTYSKEFILTARDYIIKHYGEQYININIDLLSERQVNNEIKTKKSTKKKDEKVVQEAHEAIRPTNIGCTELGELGNREVRLYNLIRRNTIESCLAPATYKAVTACITAPIVNDDGSEYRYSTEQVVFPGWKIVAGYEVENPDYIFLQTIKNNTKINYKKITSKVSMKDLKNHYTEAKLVQLLEKNGIGRPSTFSSLIDKIQERGYVKKMDVKGKNITCVDFELDDAELSEIETSREFGNEKNKLIIQPIGILVLEFLLKHFNKLFEYEYTKNMEDSLDSIAKGSKIWHHLCKECFDEINKLSVDLIDNKIKESIKIDEYHSYTIGKYGPVIKCVNGNKTTFKNVRNDIDLDKLRKGEINLDNIIATKSQSGKNMGKYKNLDVILKSGQYGFYVECGEVRKSLNFKDKKSEGIKLDDITLDDIIPYLEIESSYSRIINKNLSIRNGKFGDYIFYKTPKMKSPKFLKLTEFIKEYGKDSYKTCELELICHWIRSMYKITI